MGSKADQFWSNFEQERRLSGARIQHRASKRVSKTVAMREEYRKGELTKEEYIGYLNSGRCGTIIS